MKIYSILMIIISFSLLIVSFLLYSGETKWLNSFNKSKYKNKKDYSKFLGKCILYFAFLFLISGLIGLIIPLLISIIILVIGIILLLIFISKKGNKFY